MLLYTLQQQQPICRGSVYRTQSSVDDETVRMLPAAALPLRRLVYFIYTHTHVSPCTQSGLMGAERQKNPVNRMKILYCTHLGRLIYEEKQSLIVTYRYDFKFKGTVTPAKRVSYEPLGS